MASKSASEQLIAEIVAKHSHEHWWGRRRRDADVEVAEALGVPRSTWNRARVTGHPGPTVLQAIVRKHPELRVLAVRSFLEQEAPWLDSHQLAIALAVDELAEPVAVGA